MTRSNFIYKTNHFFACAMIAVLSTLYSIAAFGQDEKPMTPGNPVKKKTSTLPATGKPRRGSTIVDDTTKNVYGPKTTKYTTEKSLFTNENKYVPIDTSQINLHRWTYIQRFQNFYKDLGNVGTALSPIYPMIQPMIGATSGFTTYAPYYETEEPRYFDTKSPYTNIYVVWGGNGRAITKIEFSRNVNSRWNFGLDYRPIWVDRQIQRQKSSRQTVSQYYDFYTTYRSKNDRYFLLGSYRRIRHRVFENGGVNLPDGSEYKSLFNSNAALNLPPNSGTAGLVATEEYRSGIHLLQHYQLIKAFQLYSMTDVLTQKNNFANKTGSTTLNYFDFTQGDSAVNNDQTALRSYQEEAGIKGNAGPLFYDYYVKLRSYNYDNHFQQQGESVLAFRQTGVEKYIGGRMSLRIDSLTELSGAGEFLIDGHYKIEGDFKSKWLDASVRSYLSKPGLMQTAYKGSHNMWINNFTDVSSQQLAGFIKAKLGPFFISPGATFTTLHNAIYFKEVVSTESYQKVLPYQSDFQILFAPEVRVSLTVLKRLTIRGQAIAASLAKNDGDALQIPPLFMNGQIAYQGPFFKGALNLQIGADIHWQSKYAPLGYATAIQQFYVQQTVTAPAFPLVDVFLNAKIKRGRFFVKYQNLVQAFTKQGYMPTPMYPGQSNLLDFGFIMLLFD